MTRSALGAAAQPLSRAVLEQAANWYAVLRDGKADPHECADWQAWLREDEAHRAAWRYVEGISSNFESLRGQPDARLAADTLNTAARRLARRRLMAGAAVVFTGGLLGAMAFREESLPASVMALGAGHHTATGEQREITLADGTRLWLNTGSAINVNFDEHHRVVELLQGEVFIDTASDATRPFLVTTRHGRMQALGTRFDVRRDATQTRLSVYEGAVSVQAAASGTTRIVAAGQQTGFAAGRIDASSAADQAREAWTRGALVADNISLSEVVEELRRYRPGHLGVADEVAQIKVYGSFPIEDTDRVLHMLAAALPIRIEQPMPWWTRIEARR